MHTADYSFSSFLSNETYLCCSHILGDIGNASGYKQVVEAVSAIQLASSEPRENQPTLPAATGSYKRERADTIPYFVHRRLGFQLRLSQDLRCGHNAVRIMAPAGISKGLDQMLGFGTRK
jgi:hypothetical protein